MLFRRPCYYDEFNCTADKCSDSCCIGWEICIDREAAEAYKCLSGDFGQRLRESISFDREPSFILNGERCPFLNEKGLCDIIINMGKQGLCQICRDHPRWFEWYGKEKEGGIGLSCEEGARLILSCEGFADYYESEVDEEPDEDFDENAYRYLLQIREELFDLLEDKNSSLEDVFDKALSLAAEAEAALTGSEKRAPSAFCFEKELEKAVEVLKKTEAVNEVWSAELEKLTSAHDLTFTPDEKEALYLRRVFSYFLWRYFLSSVFDYSVTDKIRFAIFSSVVIFALYQLKKEKSFSAFLKSSVLYSKQMEYSSENLDIFFCEC